MEEPTKIEQLMTTIVSRLGIAKACRKSEQEIAAQRNSAECDASNAIIAMAKQLKADLGDRYACQLCDELVRITGWRLPEVK